ncbi:sulfotransferase family protein [Salinibacter ruber]|uniref:sulfotransferase family protein n=1 Tax=Salinibacter ruber TaxID=146919 RepID=UPI00216A4384|nr:sulfotransferase [Salinibacter ruber]MCS4142567.1 hypothetical protein [Salinibacter ruber]
MNPRDERPIFVGGRQHSGNTMLARMLGRHSQFRAFCGEGTFFERLPALEKAVPSERQRAVAREISGGNLSTDEVLGHIRQRSGTNDRVLHHYLAAKRGLTEDDGASRWVQKATSYVFHASEIFEHLPEARFLFLVRNPLDIAASKKRRGAKPGWLRMIWGWNRGTRRAQKLEEEYPEHIQLVRYEDLVVSPTDTFRGICEFCGVAFQENCMDIPHVNRSETPFNQQSESRGTSTDRVFYFTDVLSPSEQTVVERLVAADPFRQLYPDLPSVAKGRAIQTAAEFGTVIGQGAMHISRSQIGRVAENPSWAWNRLRARIFR